MTSESTVQVVPQPAVTDRDDIPLRLARLRRRRELLMYRLCILPAVLVTLLVAVIPVGILAVRSLLDEDTGMLTARYYVDTFTNAFFMRTLGTTIMMSLAVTIISIVMAYPIAYAMARKTRLRNVLVPIVTIPRMLPFVVIGYAMILLLAPYTGVLNRALMGLNIIQEPISLLYNWPGLLIAFVYTGVVIGIGMLTGVLMSVDPQLEEAATGLGASRLRAFFTVTLPLTIPGAIGSGALIFTTVVTSYAIPVMLSGRVPYMIAPLIATNMQSLGQWHLSFAQATLVSILAIGVTATGHVVLSRYGRTDR